MALVCWPLAIFSITSQPCVFLITAVYSMLLSGGFLLRFKSLTFKFEKKSQWKKDSARTPMPTLQASSMLTFYVAECQIAGSCWCPVGKKPSGIFCNFSSFPSFSCWGHRHAVLPGEGGPVIPQNAFHKQQSNAAPSHQMLQLICGQQVGEM